RSASEFATVEEVIERARKRPGELTFGSGGQGSPHHLSGVLFANKTGAPIAHVPYQGGGPAIADLLGGHIDMVFAGLPEVIANVRAGKMRALALLSAERSPLLPDVPTLQEKGYEG